MFFEANAHLHSISEPTYCSKIIDHLQEVVDISALSDYNLIEVLVNLEKEIEKNKGIAGKNLDIYWTHQREHGFFRCSSGFYYLGAPQEYALLKKEYMKRTGESWDKGGYIQGYLTFEECRMTNYVDNYVGDDLGIDEDDYEAGVPYQYMVNW
ncbi:hypothetical protein [uncultured Pontibacter sp.]|uniref:hypothetical protein n=1 Tax=uncultured Pontibacter sp. TaxID=453356 RepID=UPI00262194EA|nr:hypothetical protein [uncultured Pontibacter sp.]